MPDLDWLQTFAEKYPLYELSEDMSFMYGVKFIKRLDRQEQVAQAISQAVGKNYYKVSPQDLKAITHLDLSRRELKTLKKEDLKGLSSLIALDLSHNQLKTLPEDIFEGLKLQYLDISYNQLKTLPEGLLRGLGKSLKVLIMNNALTNGSQLREKFNTLPKNLLLGLTILEFLDLSDNELEYLPEDLLRGLISLRYFFSWHNPIKALPEAFFQDSSSLEIVSFNHPKFKTLPETAFRGISSSLKDLSILNAYQLETVPEGLLQGLVSLESFSLSKSQIKTVPEELFKGLTLKQITGISIKKTSLSTRFLDSCKSLFTKKQ